VQNAADTLGWAYYHNGAYSVAVLTLEEAVRQEPKNQSYRYHLALAYQQLKDSGRAKVELERAINRTQSHWLPMKRVRV
jgi:Flp pilus assembly protein TadD